MMLFCADDFPIPILGEALKLLCFSKLHHVFSSLSLIIKEAVSVVCVLLVSGAFRII